MIKPTGKYKNCKHWKEILIEAKKRPHLKTLVKNYEKFKHPSCLNAIMNNGDTNLWITYYTGKIIISP